MPSIEIHALHRNGHLVDIHSTKEIGYSSYVTKVELALEEKYLPKHYSKYDGKEVSRCFDYDKDFTNHKEIWDLIQDKRLTRNERIVLGFYFTRSFVFGHKSELIEALKSFDKEHNTVTSCNRISEIIENNNDEEHIGYRISNSSSDDIFGQKYNEETDEYTYYNFLQQNEHFDLFKYIEDIERNIASLQ